MVVLILTEIYLAIFMFIWAITYFSFPEPLEHIANGLSPENPLRKHLKGISHFVRQAAWTHLFMGLFSLTIVIVMLIPSSLQYIIFFRYVMFIQIIFGAYVSLKNIIAFRKSLRLSGISMKSIFMGMRLRDE